MSDFLRWKNGSISIRAILKNTYLTIIAFMAIPTVILLATLLIMTNRYNALIDNTSQASQLRYMVSESLIDELWDIVAGKMSFGEGTQYTMIEHITLQLKVLEHRSNNENQRQNIVAAERAVTTLRGYVDTLGSQIAQGSAVSYHQSSFREISSVAALTQTVLQQYIDAETSSISSLNTAIQWMTLIVVGLVALILGLAIAFAVNSYRAVQHAVYIPIHNLEQMAGSIAGGNLSARAQSPELEELVMLTTSLNAMAGRLQELIDERVLVEKTLQKAEMRALQAQITPHFLYNTFETIIWLAEQNRNREVVSITMALTDFLRITLSRGQDYITVKREAQHVRSYLTIQSVRYGSIMSYEVDIDPALENCSILKLLLQPLVENAIYHGIKAKRGRGHISVTGRKTDNGEMVFCVSDTGIGMSTEKLLHVQEGLSTRTQKGFGLYNVNKRLQLYYGGSGLQIESVYREGTRISFSIPALLPESGGAL